MTTPKLGAPVLVAGQAVPETTVNEQIRYVEQGAQWFGAILDRNLTAPPGSPSDGDAYIVATSATGDWAGKDGKIAFRFGSAWNYITPTEGMAAYFRDEDAAFTFDGSDWNALGVGSGVLIFRGDIDASTNPNYPAATKGDAYLVSAAGKVGGASGKDVNVGDLVVASDDNAGGDEAAVGTDWFVLASTLDGVLLAANNLSDVDDAATSRDNLGLGTAATLDFSIDGTFATPSDTELPTTQAVFDLFNTAVGSGVRWQGAIDCSTNPEYPSGLAGDVYFVSLGGKIGGEDGREVEFGSLIYCIVDSAGGAEEDVSVEWSVFVRDPVHRVGILDCSSNPVYPRATKGQYWLVAPGGAGKIGGASGRDVAEGDWIVADSANDGGDEATVGAHWSILHVGTGIIANLDDLSDVNAPTPAVGDTIIWDGSEYVNGQAAVTYATHVEICEGTVDDKAVSPAALHEANIVQHLSYAATLTFDLDLARNWGALLEGDALIDDLLNRQSGDYGFIILQQDGTGGRTVTFDTNWHFSGSDAINIGADEYTLIFYQVETSTAIIASILGGSGGSGFTAEQVRDVMGIALTEGTGIDITVDDGADTITIAADISEVEAAASDIWTGTANNKAITPNSLFDAAAEQSIPYAATVTLNFGTGINFAIGTLTGNITLANPNNAKAGQSGVIFLTQDGTGSRTITYGSNWRFSGGSASGGVLSTAAGAKDVLNYFVRADGTIFGALMKGLAA